MPTSPQHWSIDPSILQLITTLLGFIALMYQNWVIHASDKTSRQEIHQEQIKATSEATTAASAAFKEANAVNFKILGLQQTANAALVLTPQLPAEATSISGADTAPLNRS